MNSKGYIFSIIQFSVFFFSLITDFYTPLIIVLSITAFLQVLDKLGKGIVLREMMALHGIFVCLLMPLMGYLVYNPSNKIASLWVRYMPIAEDRYFEFALPAIAGFALALCWPMNKPGVSDHGSYLQGLLDRGKLYLANNPMIGVYLLIIGVGVFTVSPLLPVALQFAFLLFYFSAFAGWLYVYFTTKANLRYKVIILVLFALFILVNALQSGMFTIVAYMGITLFSFFFVGKQTAMWKKMTIFIIGAFALVLLQSVKGGYRKATWRDDYEGNKAVLLSNLLAERLESEQGFATTDAFFPIYYRANQGFNVAMVMKYIPANKPYDEGVNLTRTLAASLVPRIFWPDKPEAGGRFNMKYYTGYNLKGWSTNVGPLGEAYGSFGVTGGIIYMIFLGIFIRWAYRLVFVLSKRTPLLLFWIPILFYQITYSLESDTLQILNSLFKSGFFVWVFAKFMPRWFGIIKHKIKRPGTVIPGHPSLT